MKTTLWKYVIVFLIFINGVLKEISGQSKVLNYAVAIGTMQVFQIVQPVYIKHA